MDCFKDAAAHTLKGLMYHREFEDYMRFLGFDNLADMQRKRYLEESNTFACINTEYIKLTGKLLNFDTPAYESVIPKSWYDYDIDDVDNNTRRNYLKSLFVLWINWERETITLYEKIISHCHSTGQEEFNIFFDSCLKDTHKELQKAESLWTKFEMCEWTPLDILLIM